MDKSEPSCTLEVFGQFNGMVADFKAVTFENVQGWVYITVQVKEALILIFFECPLKDLLVPLLSDSRLDPTLKKDFFGTLELKSSKFDKKMMMSWGVHCILCLRTTCVHDPS